MERIYYTLICVFMLSFTACAQSTTKPVDVSWLVGSWQGTYNDKPFYEAWRKLNDSPHKSYDRNKKRRHAN